MLDRLAGVEQRFEELNRQLSDPSVLANQEMYRALAKEHRDLEKMVEVYRKLKSISDALEENQALVASGDDPELAELAQEEIPELAQEKDTLENELKILLLPKDPNDEKNVILEVRAGTGGDEASLFAGELFRMYTRYAELKGWRAEIMSMSEGTQGGVKEAIALISGDSVFSSLKYESGVHRVQRVPSTESQGRIHTSAVTVVVMPEATDIELQISDNDIRVDVYRSSGPGGQSVNTTDSAVRITHIETGLVVTCQDEKSQHKNKAKALKVLSTRLLDKMQAEEDAKRSAERKTMVRSGDRSEKIRTYNFPQDRMTDHRIGLSTHGLPSILQGNIEDIVVKIRTWYQTEELKGIEGSH